MCVLERARVCLCVPFMDSVGSSCDFSLDLLSEIQLDINTVTTNKVMVIKDHGGADTWEQLAAAQQHKLISNAKKTNNVIDVTAREV